MKCKIENFAFTVLSRDKQIADVCIKDGELSVETYTDNRLIQVFPRGSDTTIADVYNFLRSRCYEDGRADLAEILKTTGMTSNNPWEWCRKTHGVTYDDFYWLRFPGEENLTWEEVKVRD